ncbi:ABC transporter permease [Streptomyces sp. NBC_01465]|uniref:ABC transporter permease n=1 Tax=Streptomyces sp. NBC_01465 TaxID=2903878 RepID=UPI002E371787|nr:ABC transporter permease [Streptomyces sp. NBC_01465]
MSSTMNALNAEWIKLRTLRSTWWAVAASALAMVASAPLTAMTMTNNNEAAHAAPGSVAYTSVAVQLTAYFVQFIVIAPAVLAITSEYAHGSLATSLQCVPVRARLLLAKAGVVAGLGFGAGVLNGALGTFTGGPSLEQYGVLDGGQAVRQILAMGVFCALAAVFALGTGAVLRSSAGTVTVLFVVMLVLPLLLLGLAEVLGQTWLANLSECFPSTAGIGFMSGDTHPFGPAVALLILAAWAAAALAAAARVLNSRDA